MGRHASTSYPWNNKENNDDENESISPFSVGSLSRSSSSDDSNDTPSSPKAVDPEDLECQIFYCDLSKVSNLDDYEEKRQKGLLLEDELEAPDDNEAPSSPHKKNELKEKSPDPDQESPTSTGAPPPPPPPPRSNRWWEPSAPPATRTTNRWWEPQQRQRAPRWWERTSESSISPSQASPIPPPTPLRSSRRLSLPGAFPVAGIGITSSDGYSGEEEKFEDEHSSSSFGAIDSHSSGAEHQSEAETLLLEATLVSEKSSRWSRRGDHEQRSNNEMLVFQAEPLQMKRLLTMKSICCLICLLLFIAVIGIAVGTELGRRRYEANAGKNDSDEPEPPPRNLYYPILDSGLTSSTSSPLPQNESSSESSSNSSSSSSSSTEAPIMQAPPVIEERLPSIAPSTSMPARGITFAPSTSPETELEEEGMNPQPRFLDKLPDKTKKSIYNPGSPQFLAYKWLLGDPQLNRYSVGQQIQRFALATLYFAAGGRTWQAQNEWLSYGADACEWESDTLDGLRCREDGEHKGWYEILDLNQNTLNGTLPEEVWLLSTLVSLQLYDHDLQGSIPTRVGKMLHLESLLLFDMKLEGSIPKEIGLTKLKSLHVGGNALTGSLPEEIGNIQQLRHLFVNDNQHLNGTIPSELGRLTELEELALQNNSFVGTIPSNIGLATNLRLAYFAFNKITGTIPEEFNRLSNLEALILQSNSLQGSIPHLANLSKVDYLLFGSNKLTGTIPGEVVAAWESVSMLDFGNNNLSGNVPAQVGLLDNLQYLDLFNNKFSGTIPIELGKLYNAEQIMLEQNRLTGTIPTTFGALTKLERLWLHDNDLSGTVPIQICNLMESGSLRSLSVDCHRVACECCDCSMSMPQAFVDEEGNAVVSRQGSDGDSSNNLWDKFVDWVNNL